MSEELVKIKNNSVLSSHEKDSLKIVLSESDKKMEQIEKKNFKLQ